MKKVLSVVSVIIGIIGLFFFFKPVPEIACGVVGLITAILAKDKEAGMVIDAIRSCGLYLAWINIIWVCLEFALSSIGSNFVNSFSF